MGYYTRYKLEIIPQGSAKPIPQPIEIDGITYVPQATIDGPIPTVSAIAESLDMDEDYLNGSATTKWYESEDDMRKVSLQFPEYLFILRGEGEESGDLWVEYYLNGKTVHHQAQIVYPEFKMEDLK